MKKVIEKSIQKNKTGRKPVVLSEKDLNEIETLSGLGLTTEEIALVKRIDRTTMRNLASDRIERGRAVAKQLVVNQLFSNIKKNDTTAIIFYLKTQCGWSESMTVNNKIILPQLNIRAGLITGGENENE